MHKKIVSVLLTIFLAPSAFAASTPTTCPSVAAMKSVGVDSLYRNRNTNTWMGMQWSSEFDTKGISWTLAVGQFALDQEATVLEQANKVISDLILVTGPMKFKDPDTKVWAWSCVYRTDSTKYAVTVTPAHVSLRSFSALIS